jgi:hypothetical protein
MPKNMSVNPSEPLGAHDGEATARPILDNDELVARILDSARELSLPMRIDEFMEWIRTI